MHYRKIWESVYGEIPKDEFGRSYEIHHMDGNRKNNSIENLQCVSIEEHYNIHLNQKDYGACKALSIRLKEGISSKEKSEITRLLHTGKKRNKITGERISQSNKGRKLSEEHKLKISKANSGKKRTHISDEHRMNLSKSLTGKKRNPMSDETKEKIRQFQKKKTFSLETREKISQALKGKSPSLETREKMRQNNIGKKHSEETKEKMRNSKLKKST